LAATFTTLAGAATALSGAFGLVVGSGLLAFGRERSQQNQERLEQINQEIEQLEELREQRGSLTDQQQEELETLEQQREIRESDIETFEARISQIDAEIESIRNSADARSALTDAQEEELATLRERRDELIQQSESQGTLTQQQQERLQTINQEIASLQEAASASQQLTQSQQQQIQQLQSHRQELQQSIQERQTSIETVESQIQQLEQQQQQTGELTEQEQERLATLEEQRDELEEQTSITGALGAAFSDLGDELVPIIADFGEQFVPLIEDALEVTPELVENILDAVGGMQMFAQALRDFGNFAFRALPQVARFFADLARDSLPTLRRLARFIAQNARPAVDAIARSFNRSSDALGNFGSEILRSLPQILQFGTTVLTQLVPALSGLLSILTDGIQTFNNLRQELQQTGTQFLLLTGPVVSLTALLTSAFGPAGFVLAALGTFTAFIASEFPSARQEIVSFATEGASELSSLATAFAETQGPRIISFFRDALPAIRDFGEAWISEYGPAVRTLLENITRVAADALPVIVDGLLNVIPPLAEFVGEGIQLLNVIIPIVERFGPALADQFRGITNVIGGTVEALTALVQFISGDFQEAEESFVSGAETIGEGLAQITEGQIEALRESAEVSFDQAVSVAEDTAVEGRPPGQESAPSQGQVPEVTINFEGEGRIEQVLEEIASSQVEQQGRRTRRTGNRSTSGR
jgi:phage-related protein